jgi:hypothetical protein
MTQMSKFSPRISALVMRRLRITNSVAGARFHAAAPTFTASDVIAADRSLAGLCSRNFTEAFLFFKSEFLTMLCESSSRMCPQMFLQRVAYSIESLNDSLLLLLRSIKITSRIFDITAHNGRFPRDSQIKLVLSRINTLHHYLLNFHLTLKRRDAGLLPRNPNYSEGRLR